MEGLAQSMAGPAQQPQHPQSNTGASATPEDVVALLMQGVPPEELENMGVPPEVIMQAIEIHVNVKECISAIGGDCT